MTKKFILFFLFMFCSATLAAINLSNNTFNIQKANKTLNELSIYIASKQTTVDSLQKAINTLANLQVGAKTCINETQDEINTINKQQKEMELKGKAPKEMASVQKYLKNKKVGFMLQQSECRLFMLRSDETISVLSKKTKVLSTKKLFKLTPSFLSKIAASKILLKSLHNDFNTKLFFKFSGLKELNQLLPLILFGCLLLIGVFGSIQAKKTFDRHISKTQKSVSSFFDRLELTIFHISKQYIVLLTLACILALFFSILGMLYNQISYLMLISYGLLALTIILVVIQFLFYPVHEEKAISDIHSRIANPLVTRLNVFSWLCFFGFIIYIILRDQPIPLSVTDFLRTIFITLFAISLISILWLINRFPKILQQHKILQISINILLSLVFFTILVAEWLGYIYLVSYILRGIILTLLFGLLAWVSYRVLIGLLKFVSEQPRFRQYLHLKKNKTMPEIIWFGLIAFILIWGWYLLSLLKIWGLSEVDFRLLTYSLIEGFKIAHIKIVPLKILSAFLLFTILFALIRWFRAFIENRYHADKTVDTIIAYVSVSISILVALLVAGINFAGLAIIAGALSVGIGFGLQNIVNNFVSGIILLVERPIKLGDRVRVGNIEGFVRRISIRATQIQTLALSYLVVPNSELISKAVTNLTLYNTYSRLGVSVGVAYNSDVELVKKLLLEIANAHPDVVSEDLALQPQVYFTTFEKSVLNFNLYFTIRNVNLKYKIPSEINSSISKIFKHNNIDIAYPQMDIHIKDGAKEPQVTAVPHHKVTVVPHKEVNSPNPNTEQKN